MGTWHQRILNLEKEHRDSRVAAFKKRRRFRRRYERQGFTFAHDKDTGATSDVIRAIRHAIYCSEQCAEYGLSDLEKKQYFDHFVRAQLPARYAFLQTCGYEIATLPF